MARAVGTKESLIIAVFIFVSIAVFMLANTGDETPEEQMREAQADPAPALSLADLESNEAISLDAYTDRPLLIHFFASWCPLCSNTARNVATYYDEAGDFDVLLVALDPRETDDTLVSFKSENGRESWRLARLTPVVEDAFDVRSLDTKVVIADGEIVHRDNQGWQSADARRILGGLTP